MISIPLPAVVDALQLKTELEAIVGEPLNVQRVGDTIVFDSVYVLAGHEAEIRQAIRDHRPADLDQFEQLVEKARRVWRDEDTFTAAQAQKILAGLVLVVARYLR